jgi:hypothetical protein
MEGSFSFTYPEAMNEENGVSRGRRITDFFGLTDSPRARARTIEKTTPTELLIRAVVLSCCAIGTGVVFFTEPRTGFLIAAICMTLLAALSWLRWSRYRNQ